jgi:uncharacterized membrane protein YedE/YeeE
LAGVVLPKITIPAPSVIIIAGGLLVGFGTCLGGPLHERTWRFCGLARLSLRSLFAYVVARIVPEHR